MALLLATAGVIGLWGIGVFSPELIRAVLRKHFDGQHLSGPEIEYRLTKWVSIAYMLQWVGGFFGAYAFSRFTARVGRKPAFALAFLLAPAVTAFTFWNLNSFTDVFWMIPCMGFCLMLPLGGYAIYFPELFPTRLRSTGTSFCYNVGRYLAALGPWRWASDWPAISSAVAGTWKSGVMPV